MFFIILCFLILLAFLYFFLNRHHGYLEKLSLPLEKTFLCFGSPPYNWHQRIHHDYFVEAFKRFKTKTFARYAGSTPTIVTIDPEIIKQVTIKQFNNFPMTLNANVRDKNLSLDVSHGPVWKLLRKELSPVFTSGKLKAMMEPVSAIGDLFVDYIDKQRAPGKSIYVKDMFKGLTLDVINSVAYGISTNSREEPDHHLLQTSNKMIEQALFSSGWTSNFFILFMGLFPELLKYVNIFGNEYDKLIEVANSIIHQRESGNIKKSDFINVLVEMRKKNREDPNELINDDIITAQAVIFFVAGSATTAISLSCLMYTLATNPEIQERLYYDIISSEEEEYKETSFLTAVIKETLRMYPPATLHLRVCTQDTEVEGIPVKKGTVVEMPIYASHFDPDFFPNPEEFRPERFLSEEIMPHTYRPFGDGNRICIAYRFAMMELHLLIKIILKKFQILPTDKTKMVQKMGAMFLYDHEDIGVEFLPRNE